MSLHRLHLFTARTCIQIIQANIKKFSIDNILCISLIKAVLDDAFKVQSKMDAATALIDGLAGERIRWTEQSALFKAETERLVGDVFLLVGFLNYAGPFNQEFRITIQKQWLGDLIKMKIPVTNSLNVSESLSDTATVSVLLSR